MHWHTLIALVLLLAVTGERSFSIAAQQSAVDTALPSEAARQGSQALQRGAFDEAIFHWLAAARAAEQAHQPVAQSQALLHAAQGYRALGHYQQALHTLSTALSVAEQSHDTGLQAAVLQGLGDTYIAVGEGEKAGHALQQGLQLARAGGTIALTAALRHSQGSLQATQEQYDAALASYRESAMLATQSGHADLAVNALLNAADVARHAQQFQVSLHYLTQAGEPLRLLPASHTKAHSLMKAGLLASMLRTPLQEAYGPLMLQAAAYFHEAADLAQTLTDRRALSYAWGYLGSLYEAEQRYAEAQQLTRQALFAAQQVQAPESLYRWQWQEGRLLAALGDVEGAIIAYQRAVATLQSFRQERAPSYTLHRASFRETFSPLYFGLVDLLLQRASVLQDSPQVTLLLQQAQQVVETFKAVELREYFQDDCVDATRTKVASLEDIGSQTTAIIYPIPLPDRLELLVRLPDGLTRVSVRVDSATLIQEVRALRATLEKRTTREYLLPSQHLYNWLIRPLEQRLAAFPIDTLVFVPDGALRTIPMAALHDGEQFLIEKYALATTPGLSLTDPRPLPRSNTRILAAALTEGVQGFAPLPHVADELKTIDALYRSDVLLNEDFRIQSVERAIQEEPFTIVHIASHGQFAGKLEETFLLAFDDKLTLDRLSAIIGQVRYRSEPLELLILSACQTAVGDDRAALGLAGIAIRAGARSALATLWSINDQASSELVTAFYRQLHNSTLSRAAALRQAQLTLLKEPRYAHPFYWSPFLLLNNWL